MSIVKPVLQGNSTMQTILHNGKLQARPPRVVLPPSVNLITSLSRIAKKHRDITHVLSPVLDFYFLNEAKMVDEVLVTKHMDFVKGDLVKRGKKVFGEGLLTSEGEFHHRQKRLVQPAFYSSKVASYSDTMMSYTDRMLGSWKEGQVLDIHKEMTHLTMSIMAKCLFDKDIDTAGKDTVKSLSDVVEYFDRLSGPFAWFLGRLPINGRYEISLKKIDRMIYDIILERKRISRDYADILSMLLRAKGSSGQPAMSDKQVHDETLILFAAGHETTANALSWAWYLISKSPRVETKLYEEIDLVLGKENRLPTAEDIPRLDYTRKVFTETLRLYPPAWAVIRQAARDVRIGEYEIPLGANVLVSQYILQRDSRYFPQPERFDPDRWTDEMKSNLPKMAYFPFGGGPRGCVGEPFAWMEGILVLARIASKWKLELQDSGYVEMLPRTTLRPKKGIIMRATRRD